MSEYPLFPNLSETGAQEAQALIDVFKTKIKAVLDELLGELYVNILPHIESDSWTNYRNAMMDGFRNYPNRLVQGEYDFKAIRQQIYKEYRDEIIKDLDQDNLKMIKDLEARVEELKEEISQLRFRGI